LRAVIVDQTEHRYVSDEGSERALAVDERLQSICERVADTFWAGRSDQQRADLKAAQATPQHFYRMLLDMIGDELVVVLLLPRSDDAVIREAKQYLHALQPRLLVFLEDHYHVPQIVQRDVRDRQRQLITVGVERLAVKEGILFYRARCGGHDGRVPTISEATMKRVMATFRSIGSLQELLQITYRRAQTKPPPGGKISHKYMLEAYVEAKLGDMSL
jgi:hypothetical protein